MAKLLLLFALSFFSPAFPKVSEFAGLETKAPVQVLICKSKNAYAYHSGMCRGLKRCDAVIEKVALEDAIKAKRKACGYCY